MATRSVIEIYREHGALFAALTETAVYDAEMRAFWRGLVTSSSIHHLLQWEDLRLG